MRRKSITGQRFSRPLWQQLERYDVCTSLLRLCVGGILLLAALELTGLIAWDGRLLATAAVSVMLVAFACLLEQRL